ncbi:MAG: hypothetical protein EOM53_01520 [Alphaproteobacteria bacterium]|nr:hypothetical protein [Alphaproteobacteria bacterium]
MRYIFFFLMTFLVSCSSMSSKNRTEKTKEAYDKKGVLQTYFKKVPEKPKMPYVKPEEFPQSSGAELKKRNYKKSEKRIEWEKQREEKAYQKKAEKLRVNSLNNYETHTLKLTTVELQHPVLRDVVSCSYEDSKCISKYENQGYVQLKDKPKFTGKGDIPSQKGYPTRKWRDNNNIPRF